MGMAVAKDVRIAVVSAGGVARSSDAARGSDRSPENGGIIRRLGAESGDAVASKGSGRDVPGPHAVRMRRCRELVRYIQYANPVPSLTCQIEQGLMDLAVPGRFAANTLHGELKISQVVEFCQSCRFDVLGLVRSCTTEPCIRDKLCVAAASV